MERTQLLKEIGLDEKEAKVYLALLELGSASVQELANRAGLKRTSLYYFIDHLVSLGVIEQVNTSSGRRYKAVEPEKLVEIQQTRLNHLKEALPEFMSIFNVSEAKPKVSYFEGVEQVKQIFLEEPKCQQELVAVWSGEDVFELVGHEFLDEIDRQRQEKGIKVRVVRIPEKEAPFKKYWPHGEELGRELRMAKPGTNFPIAFTIYDTHKVSFVSSKKEGWGIMVESQDFEQAMRVFFEALWVQAAPVAGSSRHEGG